MKIIETDKTKTTRIWNSSLPLLLRDVADFLEKDESPKFLWGITLESAVPGCDINDRWMAMLTSLELPAWFDEMEFDEEEKE